ncbi:MAG TPA: protoglobin domain-containing protein, partial [Hyphomicrobium sp.]|nr:protoglobin domain-containing protein [Hyphomicrobium sp.]
MPQSSEIARQSRDVDLDGRLAFLNLDEKTAAQIRALKPILSRHLPIALDKFYDKIKRTPEVSRFFRGDAQISHARSAQLSHWDTISSGDLNNTYVGNVRRIGQTHAKIGLEPRWYIGGYALLLEELFDVIVEEYRPKSFVNFNQQSAYKDLVSKLVALTKAVMLDMDFSISTYIEAAENARLRAEAEQQQTQRETDLREKEAAAERQRIEEEIAAERARVLEAITSGLSELAKQNLSYRIGTALPPQFERVRADFNSASGQLDQALQVVMQRITGITAATEQILAASENLSRRAQTTAASLEESAAALEETAVSVQSTATS